MRVGLKAERVGLTQATKNRGEIGRWKMDRNFCKMKFTFVRFVSFAVIVFFQNQVSFNYSFFESYVYIFLE